MRGFFVVSFRVLLTAVLTSAVACVGTAAFSSSTESLAARSGPVIYRCTLPNRPVDSFMSLRLAIAFFPQTGRARAADGLIWQKFHHWIPVRVITRDDRRISFQWMVRNVPARANGKAAVLPGVRETATILNTGRLFVSQQPLSADNSFSAEGSCSEARVPPGRG